MSGDQTCKVRVERNGTRTNLIYVSVPDFDSILHVNPFITNRGLAMVFNPTSSSLNFTLSLPLYYTGITSKVLAQLLFSAQIVYTCGHQIELLGVHQIEWYGVHQVEWHGGHQIEWYCLVGIK